MNVMYIYGLDSIGLVGVIIIIEIYKNIYSFCFDMLCNLHLSQGRVLYENILKNNKEKK